MNDEYMEAIPYSVAHTLVPDIQRGCVYFLYTTLSKTIVVAKDPHFDESMRDEYHDGTYEYELDEFSVGGDEDVGEITRTRVKNADRHFKLFVYAVLGLTFAVLAAVAYLLSVI